jgi:putative DNA primase/helicase
MLTHDQEHSLLSTMAAAGLAPRHPDKLFGKLRDGHVSRYELEEGKKGNSNGALCVYANDNRPAGWFWSWADSIKQSWTSFDASQLTDQERENLRRQQAETNRLRSEEQKRVWAEAAAKAQKLWDSGGPAKAGEHAYLKAKGVKPYGIKSLRLSLMVPARNVEGHITTIQFINADGTKRFLTGGQIVGSYYAIGKPKGVLLICEGFATGATLFEATGHAVAVAFNAGNLLSVAKALRAKYPDLSILICGDNDVATEGNPGLAKAREAAAAIHARFVVPDFKEVA